MPPRSPFRYLFVLPLLAAGCAPGGGGPSDGGPPAGDGAPARVPTADEFFRIDSIHRIEITVDPAEWQRFLAEHEDVDSTPTWRRADLRVDGAPLAQVGFKTFGYGSRQSAPDKPNLNLDLDKYVSGQSYAGLSRFRVKNNGQDTSALRQAITYEAMRSVGLWVPRTSYTRLFVNGQDYGFYSIEESFTRSFVRARGGDDTGAAYEAGDCHGFVPVQGSCANLVDEYARPFNDTAGEGEDLIAVCTVLAMPADKVVAGLAPLLDAREWARAVAADLALAGDLDGFSTAATNFRLYHDPGTDRLRLIIYGPDDSYVPDSLPDPDPRAPAPADYCKTRNPSYHDVFLEKLTGTAEGLALYRTEVQALRQGTMSAARIKERVNAIWAVTHGLVLSDPRRARDTDPEALKNDIGTYIDRRIAQLIAAGL